MVIREHFGFFHIVELNRTSDVSNNFYDPNIQDFSFTIRSFSGKSQTHQTWNRRKRFFYWIRCLIQLAGEVHDKHYKNWWSFCFSSSCKCFTAKKASYQSLSLTTHCLSFCYLLSSSSVSIALNFVLYYELVMSILVFKLKLRW